MESARDPRGDQGAIEQQIAAARAGSAPALGALLDAFRNYLMLIANAELDSELRKKFGASDLVQETCLHAQQGLRASKGRPKPSCAPGCGKFCSTAAKICVWLIEKPISATSAVSCR